MSVAAAKVPTNYNFHDLTGQTFGRLTVVEYAGRSSDRQATWKCVCQCGTEIVTRAGALRRGASKSCGCLNRLITSHTKTTHGMSGKKLYAIWNSMINRCENKKQVSYPRYGGKGISVCDEWKTFEGFYKDMGSSFEVGLTIERNDYTGNYEPSNCRWATVLEQANNTRRNHRILVHGQTLTIAEASRLYGIAYHTLKSRLYRGWTPEDAVKVGAGR